jgi:hypothetical protein
LAVAEGLRAGDTATDEAEIATIPTEVLAVYFRVINGAVFTLPERIFGIENGIVDLDVAGVLENIPPLQPKLADG